MLRAIPESTNNVTSMLPTNNVMLWVSIFSPFSMMIALLCSSDVALSVLRNSGWELLTSQNQQNFPLLWFYSAAFIDFSLKYFLGDRLKCLEISANFIIKICNVKFNALFTMPITLVFMSWRPYESPILAMRSWCLESWFGIKILSLPIVLPLFCIEVNRIHACQNNELLYAWILCWFCITILHFLQV